MTKIDLWNFSQKGYDRFHKKTNTEWKCLIEGEVLYLAFKFTDSIIDWIFNFFFLPLPVKPYKKMKVKWYIHAGFRLKWNAIKDDVYNIILSNKGRIKTVIITGHSQGGALATLAHELAWFHFKDLNLKTYTFGSPRTVFFRNFKKLSGRFEGIINYKTKMDIVTNVPPKILGFKDTGEKVLLGKKRIKIPTPKVIYFAHADYGIHMVNEGIDREAL